MEWQPIETAPKDGKSIIAYFPWGNFVCVAWWTSRSAGNKPGPRWILSYGRSAGVRPLCGSAHQEPTHWMPLPEPPK